MRTRTPGSYITPELIQALINNNLETVIAILPILSNTPLTPQDINIILDKQAKTTALEREELSYTLQLLCRSGLLNRQTLHELPMANEIHYGEQPIHPSNILCVWLGSP